MFSSLNYAHDFWVWLAFPSKDLDNETLLHIDAENRRQTLEEELEFLRAVHEQVRKASPTTIYLSPP